MGWQSLNWAGPSEPLMIRIRCNNDLNHNKKSWEEKHMSVDQYFEGMPERFNPEAAGDLEASIQFLFEEEGWFVRIKEGVITSGKGEVGNPTATVKTTKETWLGMTNGTVNGLMAMMTGKVKISGNVDHVTKLQDKNILRR